MASPLGRAMRGRSGALLLTLLDGGHDVIEVDRLDQMPVESGRARALAVGRLAVAGDRDEAPRSHLQLPRISRSAPSRDSYVQ